MRSREPPLHMAITTRLPDACKDSTWVFTASKTLVLGSLRSAEKLWPAWAPISIVSALCSGAANGESRASAVRSSRARHSSSAR